MRRYLAARWRRFDGPSRLAGIDLARGLAVMGMLAAHLLVIDAFSWENPQTWLDIANGRSSILFAALAGVSIALVTGGRTPVRGPARARAAAQLALRAGLLWLLGILLVATGVPVYVILPAYAILFLLTLPFLGLPARVLFPLAGVLAIVMPLLQAVWDADAFWFTPEGESVAALVGWAYPFPVWIAFVLAGMGVGRCDVRAPRTAVLLLIAGSALAALGYGLDALSGSHPDDELFSWAAAVWTAHAHSSGLLEVVGSGGFALGVIAACLLICRTVLRWVAVPVRAVGAMPLTAYTVQLLVWAAVALAVFGSTSSLDAFRSLEPFWPMTLGIVGACTLWVVLIGRGPLEAGMAWVTGAVARDAGERRR